MSRNFFSILISTLVFSNVIGQDITTNLKENAIKIEKLDSLNNKIYDLLSDNRLIMIGEMHGTNEPANLLIGMSDLFTRNGDTVQVGFEIPPETMTNFINVNSESNIYSSDFFIKNSTDGRASVAWAGAISRLNKNSNVNFFFYDRNTDNTLDRDSTMFLNIKREMLAHPTWKTITLSGNIHNMLLPFRGKNKMALYLSMDKELNLTDKFCSLNHIYQKGTMNNNIGNGLQVRDIGNIDTKYSSAVDFENYLYLYPANYSDSYSGIYFTRNVTAAKLVNSK